MIRKSLLVFGLMLIVGFSVPANKTYTALVDQSIIEWKGFKPTGEHFGTINISEGNLIENNGQLVSGSFIMNMNSIKVLDSDKPKLLNHLKSADFFEVAVFPEAKFVISGSSYVDGKTLVKGFLTIKEITKKISFLAKVSHNELGQLILDSESFKINRAHYNIKYKSKTFFAGLKDKFINDEFEVKVKVVSVAD